MIEKRCNNCNRSLEGVYCSNCGQKYIRSLRFRHLFKEFVDHNLDIDSRFCQLTANTQAPTYICRGITFCAPDETAIALQALAQNNAVYEKCMMSKGYVPQ